MQSRRSSNWILAERQVVSQAMHTSAEDDKLEDAPGRRHQYRSCFIDHLGAGE